MSSYAEQAKAAGLVIDESDHVSVTFVGPKGAQAAKGKSKPKREPQKPKKPKPKK